VSRDLNRSVELFKKACKYGHPDGCVALGRAYMMGIGVSQDPKQEMKLFEQA
jgi:TPR repeat protein